MSATPEDGILIKQYRIDYDLGDIGTLLDFNENVRITEIEEVYEDGESALHFTFGYDKKTISAVLQNITTKAESVIAKEGYGGGGIDFNMIYPVGSIYMNINSTNPATLFGIGTWVPFAQGRTFIGVGANESNTSDYFGSYPAGSVNLQAGERIGTSSFTPSGSVGNHKLTVNEIPSHNHNQAGHTWNWGGNQQTLYVRNSSVTAISKGTQVPDNDLSAQQGVKGYASTYDTGGGAAHNHGFTGNNLAYVSPCVAVYIWKRTA